MASDKAAHSRSGSKIANRGYYKTPFGEYFRLLSEIDKGQRNSKEFGSMMYSLQKIEKRRAHPKGE